jgi:two-component system response regulator PilR (NtrC family)
MALCSDATIQVEDLQLSTSLHVFDNDSTDLSLEDRLYSHEKEMIIKALEATKWNRTAAARLLGISFRVLRYRLKKLGIDS